MKRLPAIAGEWIDRTLPVQFRFEGRLYAGWQGDTVTSALAANGVRVLGRSFKYHRPRGTLSFAGHDVNVIVDVTTNGRRVPNVRADLARVEAGWDTVAVNTRGGVERDGLAILNRLGRFLPVGFYYKAFHSKRLFPRWERLFRNITGLGQVDLNADHVPTTKRYDFCDVLIVGGGPSGLAAALAAANGGAHVLIAEETRRIGGSALYARAGARVVAETIVSLIAQVEAHPRIRIALDSTATGYYADHWVPLSGPQALTKVRARAVVLAQGAYEQPVVFRGNDLPGVMLASAGQRLIYQYAVAGAGQLAVLTTNAEGYAAALDAVHSGITVALVADLRESPGTRSRALADELRAAGVSVVLGVRPVEAVADGSGTLGSFVYETRAGRRSVRVDGLWMSAGFAPAHALLYQAGGKVRYEAALEQFVPDVLPAGVYACGKLNGAYTLAERIADGTSAGRVAAGGLATGAVVAGAPATTLECPNHPYAVFPHPDGKEFVDFDEDLQIRDIENACQEGFDSTELLKRYSTMGMGPSQGKHSNLNALRILARVRGDSLDRHALTTARPMYHPVPMAQLAGRGFQPERQTPLDAWHEAHGAVWMPAANWRRPEYYALAGRSRAESIVEEVRAVRTGVGLIDVGTLGKVEAHGPHAGEFLDRVYTARYSNLRVGMTRYGLMLDESGVIIDDGVIARLDDECFYFTTTTGNSGVLFREFGRLATWWALPVGLVNLTGQFAAFNLAGPSSRALLQQLTELDLSDAAFPYLGAREATVAGIPCRLLRVGFVGELGYEIHLPADAAIGLWETLMQAGASLGIRPFGVEAQRMLRLEKGHVIIGQDTDGVTNALEIGAPWALKLDKPFFVGQRSLQVLARQPRRQILVGFTLPVGATRMPRECHLVIRDGAIAGRVTSVGLSPTLGHVIGLALVDPGLAAGSTFSVRIEDGTLVTATVATLPFYDPLATRQAAQGAA